MFRLGLLAAGALISCTPSNAGRAAQRTPTNEVDTALIRRVCVAEADSIAVGPDSLMALARSGCVMRDQSRTPIRIP